MMKSFTLLCLLGLTYAATTGYNYQGSGISTPHHANIKTISHAPGPHDHHVQQSAHQQSQVAPTVDTAKEFFYYTAPEEHHQNHQKAIQQTVTPTVKKNLKVIFIQPPEEKKVHKKPVVNVQKETVEDQTHIYVLSKEPSHAATHKTQQVQQAQVTHQKPEVHYLKYRTPQEAQHLQHQILQQYGGQDNQVHTASVPLVNYANVERQKDSLPAGSDIKPSTSYIPPGFRSLY